jgi:PTS system N-acetylglucosamine-specific IIC component
MIPIAVMPAAAILNRLGAEDVLNIPFIQAAGSEIFVYLALLFAVGIAIGMSDDHRGEAVLAAVVGYFVLIKATAVLLTSDFSHLPLIGPAHAPDSEIVTQLPNNVLIGILAGLLSVWTYNKFHHTKLPPALGFFSGRRLTPILTSLFVLVLALVLRVVWPPIWEGLNAFNRVILAMGAVGTAIFGILNRALLPLGLHHVLNSFFWFNLGQYTLPDGTVVTGDIPRFLAGDPTAGTYQVGFYPIMMFGLVGAAAAMIWLAKPEKRKATLGLLGGAALVSFLTGITEPLEFSFMFVAPYLYVAHALLTGLANWVTNYMGLRHGFGFSAGLIDYALNFGLATRPITLAGVGVVFFFIYFFVFAGMIKAFNLITPGREEDEEDLEFEGEKLETQGLDLPDDKYTDQAVAIYQALGGSDNLTSVDNCATRLRLTVNDSSLINDKQIKAAGAKGIVKPSKNAVQVIIGVEVEFVADRLKKLLAAAPKTAGAAPVAGAAAAPAEKKIGIGAEKLAETATGIIKALGGAENIISIEPTAMTRLLAVVNHDSQVDEEALRAAGAKGAMRSNEGWHILMGMGADLYAAEIQAQLIEQS